MNNFLLLVHTYVSVFVFVSRWLVVALLFCGLFPLFTPCAKNDRQRPVLLTAANLWPCRHGRIGLLRVRWWRIKTARPARAACGVVGWVELEPKATYGRLFGIWWTGGRPDRCLHCDWNDGGNKRMQEGSFVERSMRNSQRWFNSRKEEQHYGAKQYSTGALPKKKLRSRQDICWPKRFSFFSDWQLRILHLTKKPAGPLRAQ